MSLSAGSAAQPRRVLLFGMDNPDQRDSERTATVRGIGVARVLPDGVIVGLGVQHRSDAAAEALTETARKAQQLESLFRELGIEEEERVASSVTLREWEVWDESSRREVRQGYIASSRVDVRLSDTTRLGTLLAEAAARVEASVDGPRWEIRPENPAHDEARGRAMADARRRADAYAQAEGDWALVRSWRLSRRGPGKTAVPCARHSAHHSADTRPPPRCPSTRRGSKSPRVSRSRTHSSHARHPFRRVRSSRPNLVRPK